MSVGDDSVRLIWSLTSSGLGTTLSAAGNSGTYTAANQNARTTVDLRRVDDMWLSVTGTTGGGTNLQVQVNFYDDLGNLFQFSTGTTPLFATAALTATGRAVAFAGRHGAAGGSYLVASDWGQVAWTVTGTWTGVEIALFGR